MTNEEQHGQYPEYQVKGAALEFQALLAMNAGSSTGGSRRSRVWEVAMLLYHGTTALYAKSAIEEGIRPRLQDPGNWPERRSREDCVYLTTSFGATYANVASRKAKEPETCECAILEIDVSDNGKLLPDEDFLCSCLLMAYKSKELSKRKKKALATSLRDTLGQYGGADWLSVLRRVHKEKYKPICNWVENCVRDDSGYNRKGWQASLFALGTCAYLGTIPREMIKRVAFVVRSHRIMQIFKGTTTSVSFYQSNRSLLAKRNRWIFGDLPAGADPELSQLSNEGVRVEYIRWTSPVAGALENGPQLY